jgi:hypothetical protein
LKLFTRVYLFAAQAVYRVIEGRPRHVRHTLASNVLLSGESIELELQDELNVKLANSPLYRPNIHILSNTSQTAWLGMSFMGARPDKTSVTIDVSTHT